MLGNSEASMISSMVEKGIAAQDARDEIEVALASPYLQGSTRLRERLKKRDWILSVYRTLYRAQGACHTVDRRHQLGAADFFEQYYYANRPVIVTGLLNDWQALTHWNCAYFRERFGTREVEIQFGRERDADFEVNKPKHARKIRFGDYVDMVERAERTNDFYMTAGNGSHNRVALSDLWRELAPLPSYLTAGSADMGFFWFGPAGTTTPFHHDLTNNLMAQVAGRKRILLVPLHDTPFMHNHLHCYSMVDGARPDFDATPQFAQAQLLECVLKPGEVLLLPIGWWHYVEALDVSVTMTFTHFAEPNGFAHEYSTYGQL
ncbi:cupin-like domain-containing protein [Trinickia sp. LjRoot230]